MNLGAMYNRIDSIATFFMRFLFGTPEAGAWIRCRASNSMPPPSRKAGAFAYGAASSIGEVSGASRAGRFRIRPAQND
jgi:hypothetical protein